MRLISAQLANYKLHNDLRVEFHPDVTVISGPNEAGKSTLVEAIHRGLFLRSKTTGSKLKEMKSRFSPGNPEVSVEFVVGEKGLCRVKKIFAGQRGTTTVNFEGRTFHGDEAERKLAEILGEEPVQARGGKQAVRRWSHLWVWQGRSSEDVALELETAQKNELLIRRVQELGGASVVQSELDARVAAYFKSRVQEIFTNTGKPRATSPLARLQRELSEALDALEKKKAICNQISRARQDYILATRAMETLSEKMEQGKRELQRVLKELDELDALEQKRKELKGVAQERKEWLSRLVALNEEIVSLERSEKELGRKFVPLDLDLERLGRELSELRKSRDEFLVRMDAVREELSKERRRLGIIQSCERLLELEDRLAKLKARQQKLSELESQLELVRRQMAQLPKVSSGQMERIRKAKEELARAEAALDAMATGVEVIEAPEREAFLDGRPLSPGKEYTVTQRSQLTVGDSVVLAIIPGGGHALSTCQDWVGKSRAKLQTLLDEVGVSSVREALEAFSQLEELKGKEQGLLQRIEDIGGKGLDDEMGKTEDGISAARAEISRLESMLDSKISPPENQAQAKELIDGLSGQIELLEKKEGELRAKVEDCQALERAKSSQREQIVERRHELEHRRVELEARLKAKLEEAGDEQMRLRSIEKATKELSEVEAELKELDEAIARLQPELLRHDKQWLTSALEQQERELEGLKKRKIAAETLLRQTGSSDSEAELKMEASKVELLQRRLAQEQVRAEAFRMVHDLFQQKHQELAARFSEPLSKRISLYLASMFGPGVQAQAVIESNTFKGVQVRRPQMGDIFFSFSELSQGTREQVAAAVRLAIAEILATGHEGCLPVVFDDAFTNSDSSRVMYIQRMLNLASRRGLQIILLTSKPSDYSFVNGATVRLEPNPLASEVK
ncbi:MAG: AAA family ATPase [Thermodesulfobacteria bacterium]|nr:AAA family ATPase [Thermodesulfobacteriota bacterium]